MLQHTKLHPALRKITRKFISVRGSEQRGADQTTFKEKLHFCFRKLNMFTVCCLQSSTTNTIFLINSLILSVFATFLVFHKPNFPLKSNCVMRSSDANEILIMKAFINCVTSHRNLIRTNEEDKR